MSSGLVPSGLVLAAPVTAAGFDTSTYGRPVASAAALLGLAGVVVGWLALARPAGRFGTGGGRGGAVAALAAGLAAVAFGGLVAAASDGGLGTGNGLGGAFVALATGLAATALGARAVARTRRATAPAEPPAGRRTG